MYDLNLIVNFREAVNQDNILSPVIQIIWGNTNQEIEDLFNYLHLACIYYSDQVVAVKDFIPMMWVSFSLPR